MNKIRDIFATSLLALAAGAAMAAGSPGVEPTTQSFLEALAKGGGKPLETMSPADARAVLVGAQAGAKLPSADVSEKTITADGKTIKLTLVRPVGAKGALPLVGRVGSRDLRRRAGSERARSPDSRRV